MVVNLITPDIGQIPILYGPLGNFIRLSQLSETAIEIIEPLMLQVLLQAGLEFFNRIVFELKWKPKDDASSSEEEPPQRPSDEELAKL